MLEGEKVLERLSKTLGKHVLVSRLGIGQKVEGEKLRVIMDEGKPLLYIDENSSDGFMSSDKFDKATKVSSTFFNFVEIVDIGDECYPFTKEMARVYREDNTGVTVLCKPLSVNRQPVGDTSSYFFVSVNGLYPVLIENDKLKPLGCWVTIELDRQDKDKDILIEADSSEHPSQTGTILNVGDKVDPELKEGVRVMVNGILIIMQIDNKWICICRESSIIGVIE